ncbi:MAG: hypothetical protein ACO1OO_15675 [Flavisolibacter sp.]
MKKLRIPLLFLIVVSSAFLLKGRIPHEKFNSNLWKTANLNLEKNWSLRWDMMNDLRNKHKLVGMSKKEIVNLLGMPDGQINNEFIYYLGYSKTGINTGSFWINFNEDEVVTDIKGWQG